MIAIAPAMRCRVCNELHYLSGGGLCLDCSDAGRRAVEEWSLVIHGRSGRHEWVKATTEALINDTEPPLWPGGRKSTGVSRLDTIRRLLKLEA